MKKKFYTERLQIAQERKKNEEERRYLKEYMVIYIHINKKIFIIN